MVERLPDRVMLETARALLDGRIRVSSAGRVRGAAAIGRTALEYAIDLRLRELTGGPIGTRRTGRQLVCLRVLTDGASWAQDAAWAYSSLSGACHEHAYELEPTAAEVQHLLDLVERVVEGATAR